MKKILLVVTVALAFAGTACTQNRKAIIPDVVKQAFTKNFPGVTATWEKENAQYEAEFTFHGKKMSALFESDGTMLESETEIKKTELPAFALSYISANYKGSAIKEAAKIKKANGEIQYEAEVKGMDLIFDESGKFLRKIKG